MKTTQIYATSGKLTEAGVEEIKVNYNFGETLAEEVERIGGEEKALAFLKSAITIKLQSILRSRAEKMLKDGAVDFEKLQVVADEYVPGNVSRERKSKVDKGIALAEKMSASELEEYAQMLAEIAAEKQAENGEEETDSETTQEQDQYAAV